MIGFLKKNKFMVSVVGIVAVSCVIIGLASVVNAKEAEVSDQVDVIVSDVNALYADETKAMLADGVTMDMVVAIEEKVSEVEESDSLTEESKEIMNVATTDLEYAKQMVELRDMALALLDNNGILVDGANVAGIQVKANELKETKPDFVASIQPTIDEAQKQQDAITTGTKNVTALFTDETRTTVRTDVTRSEYDTAQSSVDEIKNKTSKDTLQKSLNTVDAFLDEQEAIAQAEAEKEETAITDNDSSSSNDSDSSGSSSSPKSDGGSLGSSSSGGNGGEDGSWSGEVELEVDYYQVHSAIAQDGSDITDEVNHIKFETEEEMNGYMYSNYPGCSFSYTIAYKEIW